MKPSAGYVTRSCIMHKHNCHEIIYYRKGNGKFYFSDDFKPIKPGEFMVVPPGIVHASRYDTESETFFTKGDFNHIFYFQNPVIVADNEKKDGEFLMKLIYENRYSNPEYLSSLSNALAHFLMQNIRTEKNINIVLKDIIATISDNFYNENINIGEIFRKSGYAEDYIRSQFKVFTGKTPVEFLTEMRINHACYLIEVYRDSVPLTEIAEKCGYTDYVYFSRRFKDMIGVSPKNYKQL